MSAMKRLLEDMPPKPVVRQIERPYLVPESERLTAYWMPGRWGWSCGCGAGWGGGRFREALHAASQHSRRHTADRVLAEVERRKDLAYADSDHLWARGSLIAAREATGNGDGLESAANLIREHLTRRAE